MATKEQVRARARRRHEKRIKMAAQRAERRARIRRVVAVVATVAVVGGGATAAALAFGGDEESSTAPGDRSLAGCAPPPESLGTGAELTLPDKATAAGKTFVATMTTNCGDIELTLDGAKAPQAVASFLQLARQDYWRNGPCHRLTTTAQLKVLQCGDPTGTGQGTPGYGFGVENAPAGGAYPRGTLAMARTQDPKAGNGGQFFLVYDDSSLPDPAGYTIFGTVTEGLDIVDRVAAEGVAPGGGSPEDGPPAAPISILSVAVTEKKA
ncbi:MAG: peptidylprolyl isomerase [Dermatophilaceae bacterium]